MRAVRLQRLSQAPAVSGLRRVVWDDLRDDLPRLRDLPPALRVIGLIGIAAIVAATAELLLVDRLRVTSTLLAGHADLGGRAQLVPVDLVPLTLGGFVVAWTFLLAGATRAHLLPAVLVTALFAAVTLVWVSGSAPTATPAQRAVPVLATLLAMAVAIAARWVAGQFQLVAFAALLAAVTVAYGGTAVMTGSRLDLVAVETPVVTLGLLLSLTRGLVLPFLVVVGFGTALFAYRIATWVGDTVSGARGSWVQPVALAALATACLVLAVRTLAAGAAAVSWVGALIYVVLPLGLGAVGLRLRDGGDVSEATLVRTAERSIPAVAAGFFAPVAVVTVALLGASAVGAVIHLGGGGLGLPPAVDAAVNRASAAVAANLGLYRVLFVVGAAAAGAALIRRRAGLGLYLVVLGVAHGWVTVTSGTDLAWVGSGQVAAWLTVGVVAKLGVDVAARRLDAQRVRGHAVALGIVIAFGQVGIFDSPFHPVFALTGVTLVVAAVGLDTLTSGSWANVDTPLLPRASRLPLYIGYAVLTLTLVSWAAGTHDLGQFELFTGEAAAGGLRLFGDPLLLTLVAVLVKGRPHAPASTPP